MWTALINAFQNFTTNVPVKPATAEMRDVLETTAYIPVNYPIFDQLFENPMTQLLTESDDRISHQKAIQMSESVISQCRQNPNPILEKLG
jgi:NH3-dependent NAD+ synthetase